MPLNTENRPMKFRPRRLRQSEALRAMVRETELNAHDFIYPLFVRHGDGRTPIASMPGVDQLSVEESVREAEKAAKLGIPSVILFGIPAEKDPIGLENFAPDGIRINVICPGWIQTPLVEDWFSQQEDPDAARKYIYGQHPLGRIGTIEECGYLAAFLASDEAAFITGTVIDIDGGVTLGY